jgi:predicted ATPase
MILELIEIKGFRSLKSVTWEPGRLNVLIGPNGGGKSNLLRALDLLRVQATGNLREAVIRMGGMASLVWDGEARSIELGFRIVVEGRVLGYWLGLARVGVAGDVREEVRESTTPSEADGLREPELVSSGQLDPSIQGWSVHQDMRVDQDAELRRAAVTRSERRVEPDGQNLIPVLHTLYTGDTEFREFIDSTMTTAFPDDYQGLSFPPAAHGRIELSLKRKHRKRPDSTSDLSDGTLRFLLLLAILGSPDPAPLIAIDDPETGLHPRMLPIIAAVAANTAVKSQVIFTTQSPQFLDAFDRDDPLTVTVVGTNGSETILKTLAGEELKHWIDDYSLGKFAFSGEAEIVL